MPPRVARRVLEMFAKASPPKRDYRLSPLEQGILQLLVAGKIVKDAAADLGISFHTADKYIRSVSGKLQVRRRGCAVAKAVRERLAGKYEVGAGALKMMSRNNLVDSLSGRLDSQGTAKSVGADEESG